MRAALVPLAAAALLMMAGLPPAHAERSHAGGEDANIFVRPYIDKSLWFSELDPAAVSLGSDSANVPLIYAGLLKQTTDHGSGQIRAIPDLAATMPVVSADRRTYTFRLRPDARFSDGTPVTAQDVVASINRALAPAEKSPFAGTTYARILGAATVSAGKATACRGLAAVSTDTVRITLDRPASDFLYAMTNAVLERRVRPGARLTTTPSLVVGAGPFMIDSSRWQYRRQAVLVPNPYYYDAAHIKIKEIHFVFFGTQESAFAAYRAGQIPYTLLPADQVAHYRGRPEFHEAPALLTSYLALNVRVPPFDNVHFRRAVAFAINRTAIIKGVEHGTVLPLPGWYPRGVPGYDPSVALQVPHYDLAIARRELALAQQQMGSKPPTIPLTYPAEFESFGREMQQVQRDLKAIGIETSLKAVPAAALYTSFSLGRTTFFYMQVGADNPDPIHFSDELLDGGALGPYHSPAVQSLFARAAAADPAISARLYRQAQLIILNDAPVAMLYQGAAQGLVSTKYHGLELRWSLLPAPAPLNGDWANVSVDG